MTPQTPQYAAMEPTKSYSEKPTPQLRWLSAVELETKLQQYWAITTYIGNSIAGVHGEWRDVPYTDGVSEDGK